MTVVHMRIERAIFFKMEPVGFQAASRPPPSVEVPVRPVLQVDDRWRQLGAFRWGKGWAKDEKPHRIRRVPSGYD